MNIPFKKEEPKQPLNTPVIEMRKNSNGYFWWIIGGICTLIIIVLLIQTRIN